eukprot:gene2508-4878_t
MKSSFCLFLSLQVGVVYSYIISSPFALKAKNRRISSSAVDIIESLDVAPVETARTWDLEAWKKGWESCKNETVGVLPGSIPLDLEGTYFKNGPAKFEVGKELIMHPFDGDGMVTAINIKNGSALFRNRFVRTEGYIREQKARRILYRGSFGTEKAGGFLSNMFDVKLKNVANTNIIYWADRLLALWEGGRPYKLEPDSLRTLVEYTFQGLLKKGDTFSAHPRIDPKKERLLSFSAKQKSDNCDLTIFEFDKDLKVVAQRTVSIPGFVFFHDFVATEKYYVFDQSPTKFDATPFLLGLKSAGESISFESDKPAVIYLIPRDGISPMIQIPVNSHFNFHFSNAHDDDNGNVIIDIIQSSKMVLTPQKDRTIPVWLQTDIKDKLPFANLVRYTLTPNKIDNTWSYTSKILSHTHTEFPAINPKFHGQKNRFSFSNCGVDPDAPSPEKALMKIDIQTNTVTKWFSEPYEFLGEPAFASRKNAPVDAEEDDGYLLSYLFNGKTKTSEFVIFDASDIEKGPISRQLLPTNVPFSFHGNFVQGLTFDEKDITRKFKACLGLENKRWNEVNGGFSGLGLKYELD